MFTIIWTPLLALGLPAFKPAAQKLKAEPKVTIASKYSPEDELLIDKALASYKKQINNIPSTSAGKKRVDKPAVVPQPPTKKQKKGPSCTICSDQHFSYLNDLNE